MDYQILGYSAALGSAASWAVGSILFKKVGDDLPALAMTFAKGIVSVILLGATFILVDFEPLWGTPLALLILSGLLGIAIGDTLFFKALQDLGPQAVIVLMTLGQVLTVILAVLFLGETPSGSDWVGIGIVISGVTLVLYAKVTEEGGGGEEGAKTRRRGIICGILCIVAMAASILIAKKALDEVSAIQATFVRMASGTLGIFVVGLFARQIGGWVTPFKNRKLAIHFIVAVCVVTFGGFWLSLVAVKYLDVSLANTLNSTEPLFVLPLAAIFLKEKITLLPVVGTVLATAGVVLICAL